MIALVPTMCSWPLLACLCDAFVITLSFIPVSQHITRWAPHIAWVSPCAHIFNSHLVCLWPQSSAVKRGFVWDFSTDCATHTLADLLWSSCRSEPRVWFKMSPLLSRGGNTHSSIKCVGSFNEQCSFRLLLYARLSHGNEEIDLFRGGLRSISDLTLKIYRWREKYKEKGSLCSIFFSFVAGWCISFT